MADGTMWIRILLGVVVAGAGTLLVVYLIAGRPSESRVWDAWPRPYRWRREADRAMARERDARHGDDG